MKLIIRNFLKFEKYQNLFVRSITMSSQLRAEKVIEEMKTKNPYYEKYADKIAKLQETSPDEFLSRIEKVTTSANDKKTKSEKQRNYSELLHPKANLSSSGCTSDVEMPDKKLSDIMKVELIENKNADEIKQIWLEYHKQKDIIAAIMTTEQYDILMKCAKEYPIFLLPLPRSEGYEFIMLQFSGNSVHFTPLLCYQVHKENAPECLNITHYTDVRNKGLILMRGEYDTQVLNVQEAQCLANQLQMYYCKNDQNKINLLNKFTNNPDSFQHMDLISELETIKLTN